MELLIKRVLDTLAEAGGSDQVALLSVSSDSECVVEGGFYNGSFIAPGGRMPYLGTPLQEVVENGEPATFPGVMRDDLPFPTDDPNSSMECLCLPLFDEAQDGVIGVVLIGQEPDHRAPDYRMHTLNMLRTLVAAAMENARLFQMATLDSLTGLYMRHYLEIRLHEEIRRVRRHGPAMSLLMIDIDYFKQVNDTYGHQQGDMVLQEVAQILSNSIRAEIDLPCRYGGEEFIILLPSTPLEGAGVLAERIRKRCEDTLFHTRENTIRATLSIGVAEMQRQYNLSAEELIQRADLMLYEAKRSGRNQVRKYLPEEHGC